MIKRHRLVFATIAFASSFGVTAIALLLADLYIHHRAANSAGLNRWGYRGPVVGQKAAGEVRVVVLGGSTVFGYGGPWHEAAPAFLEHELRNARPGVAVSVVNLGYNNEGAFAALPNLEDYRYLGYDIVVLYQGYNDRGGDGAPNLVVYRRQSTVYRWTGYSPILPLALQEKAKLLRSGQESYALEGKAVFRPNLAARTSASALEAADAVSNVVNRQLNRLSADPVVAPVAGDDCLSPWRRYCESVVRATAYAREAGAKVLVVAQPLSANEGDRAAEQSQRANLSAALQKQFGSDRGVAYADLSYGVDLSDRNYAFDSMHLGRDGNLKLAQLMAPAVARLAWSDHP